MTIPLCAVPQLSVNRNCDRLICSPTFCACQHRNSIFVPAHGFDLVLGKR
eukprot:m.138565 g.138565  ORF g.138565 m.138565 type:complete len:50 (-) comp16074_c0_seq2:1943-2092(-)